MEVDEPSIFDLQYVLTSCSNVSPDIEEEERFAAPSLNLLGVNYEVKERVGSWYKGACFRPIRKKKVLRDITIQLRGGQLTALLGSSGSGKTSLLDVIACRTDGKVSGKVYYNNYECSKEVMKQYGAYVLQADKLLANLTVNKAIRDMGLKNVADSKIGGTIVRGISGGERRRVTVAIQLLQDPKILLLDEPTSGLDSYTARNLISSLAQLAHNGKLVLVSIHQPRSEIFKLFDQVGILSQGEMVFFGSSNKLVPYFDSIGYPCPTYANPLDHYVDLASIDRRNNDSEFQTLQRVHSLVEKFYASSIHSETADKVLEATMAPTTSRTMVRFYRPRPPNVFRVINALIGRMLINLARDRTIYITRTFMLSLFVPFICAFLGHMKNNQESIQDRIGLMYQSASVPFPHREIYITENVGMAYIQRQLFCYHMQFMRFRFMFSLVLSSALLYTGLYPEWSRFGIYYAVVFVTHFIGEIMTVGTMGVFLNPQMANTITALVLSASILYASGFLRTLSNMLDIFDWFSWVSIHKYVAEILVANEFKGLNFTCEQNGAPCQFLSGDDYLKQYYPEAVENMSRNFGALGGFMISFFVFHYRGVQDQGYTKSTLNII
ncbi:hypothetical protein KUTeg_012934 [Tegillarca granosa]|uniref:ABC transporter domain-containing protein n=1 Tax=Tegillarca granosa TaxID=220873 RepID=A0ABQ9ESA6_TEGGR|nr:hypothetical protein KUTeg_012934 [Tegillarca granosa]